MFWKRTTAWAGFWGLLTGILGAWVFHFFTTGLTLFGGPVLWHTLIHFSSQQAPNFYGAITAFLVDAGRDGRRHVRHPVQARKELEGLVWGLTRTDARPEEIGAGDRGWYRSPAVLGTGALVLATGLSLVFI